MERVIEFPKIKTPQKAIEFPKPIRTKKIINIADWTLRYQIHIANNNVDAWPFCSA
jgi:hypothetical protein